MCTDTPHQENRHFEDRLALALTGLFTLVALTTIPHYGITWDSAEYYIGDKYLHFYLSLDPAFLDSRIDNVPVHATAGHPDYYENAAHAHRNPHHTWPFGAVLGSLSKHVFHTKLGAVDPVDAHHIVLPILVLVLLTSMYCFARRYLNAWTGLFAIAILVAHPRYWAHLHNNTKDIPSSVFYSLVVMLVFHAVTSDRARTLLAAAVLWGMALATKANAFFIPVTLAPWLLLELSRRRGHRPLVSRRMGAAAIAFPFVSGAVFLALWPFLLVSFPDWMRRHLEFLMARGSEGPLEWQISPFLHAIGTMPIPFLILIAVGLVAIAGTCLRARRVAGIHLLLLTWLVIPVLRVSLPGAYDFDGIRHWIEFLPAAALIAGIGAGALLAALPPLASRPRLAGCALLALVLCPVLAWSARNHPNELVFYNQFVGGLGGAQRAQIGEATDYWGSSYRQGVAWMNGHAEPGALLLVPVAGHIVAFTEEIWLREDIAFGAVEHESEEIIMGRIDAHAGPVYVMYITRPGFYTAYVERLEGAPPPLAYSLEVDGGTLLKIFRIKDPARVSDHRTNEEGPR